MTSFLRRKRLINIPPEMVSVKKLKLNVEELNVTSFEIPANDEVRGTVKGHAETEAVCSYTCGDPFSTLYYYYRRLRTTD